MFKKFYMSKIDPHKYSQLILNKGAKALGAKQQKEWRKDNLFMWVFTC